MSLAAGTAELWAKSLKVLKSSRYSCFKVIMILRVSALSLAILVLAAPARADARKDAREQVSFGINVAQKGLWREAIYRWERAVELDPTYAEAYNDLAVGYEHEGELEQAQKAYEKALELEPNNEQIQQNYDLFKEINERATADDRKQS
jgi:Flp pilus assembly protein TadD